MRLIIDISQGSSSDISGFELLKRKDRLWRLDSAGRVLAKRGNDEPHV